jgi:hypothetical protein
LLRAAQVKATFGNKENTMAIPTTPEMIRATEMELRAQFPESYRSYILECNGGEIENDDDCWEMASIRDTTDKRTIKKTAYSVFECTKSAMDWQYFPRNGIALGDNGFGDVMFMHKSNGVIGPELFMYLHETGESVKLAVDFREYLNECQ